MRVLSSITNLIINITSLFYYKEVSLRGTPIGFTLICVAKELDIVFQMLGQNFHVFFGVFGGVTGQIFTRRFQLVYCLANGPLTTDIVYALLNNGSFYGWHVKQKPEDFFHDFI